MEKGTRLLSIFDLFVTLSAIAKQGSLHRYIQQFDKYSKIFTSVDVKTYGRVELDNLPANVHLIAFPEFPLGRYFYLLFSGFINYERADFVELLDPRAIIPALIYKFRGARVFLDYRWDTALAARKSRRLIAPFFNYLMQILAFKMSDTIGVSTSRLGDSVRRFAREDKIFLLPNFVDTQRFRPIETEKANNTLVFSGSLSREKNLGMLFEVMKQLPQFKLWVCGWGEMEKILANIKKTQRIDNVELLGMVPNQEMPRRLNQAEVFILPSVVEGHPRALIEAMACGLACIGTNVPGINDVIKDGDNGYLCEPSVQSIKDCIISVFADRERMRRVGQKAREFTARNYALDMIIERRIKLIMGDTRDIKPLFAAF